MASYQWTGNAGTGTFATAGNWKTSTANPATVQELPQVTVIANTPLPGLGLPPNQIPGNVQTGDSDDMRRQLTLNLADYLNNNFSGPVYVATPALLAEYRIKPSQIRAA